MYELRENLNFNKEIIKIKIKFVKDTGSKVPMTPVAQDKANKLMRNYAKCNFKDARMYYLNGELVHDN